VTKTRLETALVAHKAMLATDPAMFDINSYEECETGSCIMGITSLLIKGRADLKDYFTVSPRETADGDFWLGWNWQLLKELECVGFHARRSFFLNTVAARKAAYHAVLERLEQVLAVEVAAELAKPEPVLV